METNYLYLEAMCILKSTLILYFLLKLVFISYFTVTINESQERHFQVVLVNLKKTSHTSVTKKFKVIIKISTTASSINVVPAPQSFTLNKISSGFAIFFPTQKFDQVSIYRYSRWQTLYRKLLWKIIGKHQCWSFIANKVADCRYSVPLKLIRLLHYLYLFILHIFQTNF